MSNEFSNTFGGKGKKVAQAGLFAIGLGLAPISFVNAQDITKLEFVCGTTDNVANTLLNEDLKCVEAEKGKTIDYRFEGDNPVRITPVFKVAPVSSQKPTPLPVTPAKPNKIGTNLGAPLPLTRDTINKIESGDLKLSNSKENGKTELPKKLQDKLNTLFKTNSNRVVIEEPLEKIKDFSDIYTYFIKKDGKEEIKGSFRIPENLTIEERNLGIGNELKKLNLNLDPNATYLFTTLTGSSNKITDLGNLEKALEESTIFGNNNRELATVISGYSVSEVLKAVEIQKEFVKEDKKGLDPFKNVRSVEVGFNSKLYFSDLDFDGGIDGSLLSENGKVNVKFSNGKNTEIDLMDYFRTHLSGKNFEGKQLADALVFTQDAITYLRQNSGSEEDIALLSLFQNNFPISSTNSSENYGTYVVSLGGRSPSVYTISNKSLTDISDFSAEKSWDIELSRFSKDIDSQRLVAMILDAGMSASQYERLALSFAESYVKGIKGFGTSMDLILSNHVNLESIVAGESCLDSGKACFTRTPSEIIDGAYGNGLTDGAKLKLYNDAVSSTKNQNVGTAKFDLTPMADMVNPTSWNNKFNVFKWLLPINTILGEGNDSTWFNEVPYFLKQKETIIETCPKTPVSALVKCAYETGINTSSDFLGGKR